MNTNQLTYFIAVAENQNFTKAAAQCYLTQTAITQQIQILEKQMDVVLIDRTSRPIKLTPAGHIFYHEAKDILARINLAIQNTKNAHNVASGLLRIGYAKTFESSNLPNLIVSFHREYENINLQIFRNDVDNLVFGLLNNEYDIIFTWDSTNIFIQNAVNTLPVEKITSVVLMYDSHPLAHSASLSRADLKNEKLYYLTPSNTGHSFADIHYMNLYQEAGYQPNILMVNTELASILTLVSTEQGIALIPSFCVSNWKHYDNLIGVPMTDNDEYMIGGWLKDSNNASLDLFIQYLKEHTKL